MLKNRVTKIVLILNKTYTYNYSAIMALPGKEEYLNEYGYKEEWLEKPTKMCKILYGEFNEKT